MNEAENLNSLFVESINRAQFAREHGVPGGGAMIYQHITGRKPISLDAAVAYCKGFNLPLSAISQRLADVIDQLPKAEAEAAKSGHDVLREATNITSLPTAGDNLIARLLRSAQQLNPTGQACLISYADGLAHQYPAQANPANCSSSPH